MLNNVAIGKKVRDLRSKLGLTTITFGKKVGLSQAQVSRLENGLQGFRSATMLRFARVLEVDPIYFYVEGNDATTQGVAKELKRHGLAPSETLKKALANAAFLKYAERAARVAKAHKKNVLRMTELLKRHF